MQTGWSSGIIERKVLIQASPPVVFRALTEAADLAQWFCDRAASDARVGGELKAYWRIGNRGESQHGRGVFLNLVPDSTVEVHWLEEGADETQEESRHVISYSIRTRRGTSEVTMRDQGAPLPDAEAFDLLDQGWISLLRDLKEHCESKERAARRRVLRAAGPD